MAGLTGALGLVLFGIVFLHQILSNVSSLENQNPMA
jgi:hypothetical protein